MGNPVSDDDHDAGFDMVDDDIDDDMADLFSFGAPSTPAGAAGNDTSGASTTAMTGTDSQQPTTTGTTMSATKSSSGSLSTTSGPKIVGIEEFMNVHYSNNDDDENRSSAGDSFLEMLDHAQEETASMDMFQTLTTSTGTIKNNSRVMIDQDKSGESDMQEILDWLDADDELASANRAQAGDEEEVSFIHPPKPPPTLEETIAKSKKKKSNDKPKKKKFGSLKEAVESKESSIKQIRSFLEKENFDVDASVRPYLWSKVICHKTLDETLQSSIADSFQQWEEKYLSQQKGQTLPSNDETAGTAEEEEEGKGGMESSSASTDVGNTKREEWIREKSSILASRIVSVGAEEDLETCQRALFLILMNHYDTSGKANFEENEDEDESMDPLLPPVVCAILSARVPRVAAAVMLSQIVPSFMPILALSTKERRTVGDVLHRQFYLLACYHLPLLVLHLDKYIPDWYRWPPVGKLPQSWLVSHLAGETDGALMNPQWLLCLWDLVLTSSNNSLRFFLVIALLDNHVESLLLLTGDTLKEEFKKVLTFSPTSSEEGVELSGGQDVSPKQAHTWVREWSDKAHTLFLETPFTISQKLKTLEDESVNAALIKRQKDKEERMRLKAEAEATAHQEAIEAERERKAEEARNRLTRARLVAYYRQFAPEKEGNIDKILENYKGASHDFNFRPFFTYFLKLLVFVARCDAPNLIHFGNKINFFSSSGRYDILDKKLKQKYGVSFNPALKPPAPKETTNSRTNSNLLGFGNARKGAKRNDDTEALQHVPDYISVEVSPSEVLPVICWSKEANQVKISKIKKSSKLDNSTKERIPLKFYLIDSRPEAAAEEQGRFPTSVNLSPQKLTDVENIKVQEEIFEPLRGSVHIIIMGEGYSALPSLYGHKMTPALNKLICDDVSRNNECAQFFLSRGFPFVSILEGGFASALAWLYREGPKHHLRAQNVLTDFNVEASLFGQFERLHNATGREKAQRSLQNLFDSSMAAVTKTSMRLETLATEIEKSSQKAGQNNAQPGPFRNPFLRKRHSRAESHSSDVSSNDLVLKPAELEGDNAAVAASPSPQTSNDTPNQSSNDKPKPLAPSSAGSDVEKANPFSGFGAAINSSLKAGTKPSSDSSNVAKIPRNPFARFGSGGGGGGNSTSGGGMANSSGKNPSMASHLAGFNRFRKNTMARMVVPGKDSQTQSATASTTATMTNQPELSSNGTSSVSTPAPSEAVDDDTRTSAATTMTVTTENNDDTTQSNSDDTQKPAEVAKV